MKSKRFNPRAFHSQRLEAKAIADGYCCLYGYLTLCRTRGERVKDMAANIDMGPTTIWHHLRRIKNNELTCPSHSDCLKPIIEEIKKDPPKRALKDDDWA
jgi:hypothetical protein